MHKTLSKQRSLSLSYHPKLSLYFLATFVTLLLLLEIKLLKINNPLPFLLSNSQSWTVDAPAFVPLKNLTLADTAMEGNTWFMSALNDTYEPGETQYLLFPNPNSSSSNSRLILCVTGNDTKNGTRNTYALLSQKSLPRGAKLYPGLTFMSDTQYDYENIWHGLAAVAPYVAWHERNGCAQPDRWVLYHWGEIRDRMGPWVGSVVESVFGRKAEIETFMDRGGGLPNCFEKALVFRHNEGSMSRERKEEMYGVIRCKARAYCNIRGREGENRNVVRLTLLLRVGARAFRDDDAVISIFDRECRKVEGCRLTVARPNNLTFCDQVKLMRSTDILASPHGAQLTNMFLMDRNSSVMEFFPSGWLKLAGPGQYVYHWIAGSSGMRHKGAWRDSDNNSKICPYNTSDADCFMIHKDSQLGHDEAYFGNWTAQVIRETKDYKLSAKPEEETSCSCS